MANSAEQALDELLVLRSQDGDAHAMDELVCRWQRRLLRHAWHLTGHADAASDVTQEAWLAIVRGIGSLHDPAGFRFWVYRIVTHKCADWTRRRQIERRNSNVIDEIARPDSRLLDEQEEFRQLHEAIWRLGPDQRVILSLRYWEEMTNAQIATVLQVPEGTVKSRLNQARNELRDLLERTTQ